MKWRVLLVVSICLNAGLIAAYVVVKRPAGRSATGPVQTLTNTIRRAAGEWRPARVVETTVTNAFHWASLEDEDYRAYIDKLRAIGCPEQTIRDIIIADVNKLYGARLAALQPSPKDFKFWKSNNREARTAERERERKERELEREKRALIKELLGVDYEREMARWSGRPDDADRRYGFLSAERQEQIRALQDKFRALERALFEQNNGGMNAENRAKAGALRAQREAEMAQLLSPQEYEEYQLRNSWTARDMRDNLAGFEPSEDEFRRVFELRKAFDDQHGFTREGGDEAVREQRRLAQQQLEEQIKATLGEQRFKEYQLAQDERFQSVYDFTQRNNLPKETAQSLYDARLLAEQAKQRVQSDPNIPREQKPVVIAELVKETDDRLRQTLGTSYERYVDGDGRWLRRLGQADRRGGNNRDGR